MDRNNPQKFTLRKTEEPAEKLFELSSFVFINIVGIVR